MLYGISGAAIPGGLKYAHEITMACAARNVPPCMVYAMAWRESISLEVDGAIPSAATVVSGDGGHGLLQLTASFPDNWAIPYDNTLYAIDEFILPAIRYWHGLQGYCGDTLALLVFATFNEGLSAAEKYHASGDVDAGTSDEYGHGVLANLTKLVAGLAP